LPRAPKIRLDTLLVERGLAASRDRARALILAGKVAVEGVAPLKPGASVFRDVEIRLLEPDHPYVSRGGIKLAAALDAFAIPVAGRTALDIGASTGGFTDVLLRRGALRVVALDVGRGQLDWSLRTDPRVLVVEGVNARALSGADLPPETRLFDLVTVDVAFISLDKILPVVPPLLAAGSDVVALVKPQFEAGREEVGRGGIVRDPDVHARVLGQVAECARRVGLERQAMVPSPIEGTEGNREFFLHFRTVR
jgi:23S rRNA (cytidine1920-2'-O)/16S rRNA (cytidine1409-2'-O)-methyltransferase